MTKKIAFRLFCATLVALYVFAGVLLYWLSQVFPWDEPSPVWANIVSVLSFLYFGCGSIVIVVAGFCFLGDAIHTWWRQLPEDREDRDR